MRMCRGLICEDVYRTEGEGEYIESCDVVKKDVFGVGNIV